MHVPYTTLWDDIPENVKIAFSSSEELCLELELLDQDTVNKLANCRVLPGEETVSDHLSEELVLRVTSYLDRVKELLPKWMGYSTTRSSFLAGGTPTR